MVFFGPPILLKIKATMVITTQFTVFWSDVYSGRHLLMQHRNVQLLSLSISQVDETCSSKVLTNFCQTTTRHSSEGCKF